MVKGSIDDAKVRWQGARSIPYLSTNHKTDLELIHIDGHDRQPDRPFDETKVVLRSDGYLVAGLGRIEGRQDLFDFLLGWKAAREFDR